MKNRRKEMRIGALLGYANIFISVITGFLLVSLQTRYWGASEYGVYSLAASIIGYMSIMDFGMHDATIRYISIYRAKGDNKAIADFVGMSLKIYILIDAILLVVGLPLISNINVFLNKSFSIEEIVLTKQLVTVLLINLLISLPGAVFEAADTAFECFALIKTLQFIKLSSKLFIAIWLITHQHHALSIVLLDTILNIFVLVVETSYSLLGLHIKINIKYVDKVLFHSVLGFTGYIFLASISDQINWKIDSFVLGSMEGAKAVAVESAGMQLVSVLRSISAVIPGLFLPKVSMMVASNVTTDDLTDVMIRIGKIQVFIQGIILVGFSLVGKQFINLWIGKEFALSYYIFLICAIALLVPNTQSIGISILQAKNMHRFRAVVYWVISIANLIGTIALVKVWGIIGASIATAASLFVGNWIIINWYYSRRVGLKINKFFRQIFGRPFISIILSGIIGYILLIPVKGTGWLTFIINVLLIGLEFCIVTFFIGLTKEDKKTLCHILNKVFRRKRFTV